MRNEDAAASEKVDDATLQQALDEADERLIETSAELDRQIESHAAARISGCKLHVTATYTDETTQTKTYEISPVANYDELLTSYPIERERWMAGSETAPSRKTPPTSPGSTSSPR